MTVSDDARYAGAWAELTQRIALRDATVWNLIAGGTAIVTAIAGYEAGSGKVEIRQAAVVIPFFVVLMTMKYLHHELIIKHLVDYMRHFSPENAVPPDWCNPQNEFGKRAVRDRSYLVLAMLGSQVFLLAASAWLTGSSIDRVAGVKQRLMIGATWMAPICLVFVLFAAIRRFQEHR